MLLTHLTTSRFSGPFEESSCPLIDALQVSGVTEELFNLGGMANMGGGKD